MRIIAVLHVVAALAIAAPALAIQVEPEVSVDGPRAEQARGKGRANRPARVALPAPSQEELDQIEAPRKGAPHKIGFARAIPALELGIGNVFEWESVGDSASVAAISVESPKAVAVRLGLRVSAIPAAAVVRFHDPEGRELFEVTGATILASLDANHAAGEHGPDAYTWWSPVIEASTAVMEVELPAGTTPQELRMSVPLLSHLVTSLKTDFVSPKAAAACNVDATCSLGAWSGQMNAISRMVFNSGAGTFVCTGTLLADTVAGTTVPYFLTANHCIGTQSEASSLVNYWFFRSSACNSGVQGSPFQQGGGGTLLYHSTNTDVSFLQLNATPPAGTTYAGWKVSPIMALGSQITGLHHPTGDLLKISGGTVVAYGTCTAPNSQGQFSCASSSAGAATFYGVEWNSGVVEGGSSGSALFDSGKFVVGQLYGGSSTCADPTAGDVYGRFDVSYNAGNLAQWLAPSAPPPPPRTLTVTRAGPGAATGSVTSTPAGIVCGPTCSASFAQDSVVTLTATPAAGISSFAGWSGACSGTGPTCQVTMSAAQGVTATFNLDLGVAVSVPTLVFGSTQSTQPVTFTNNTGAKVTFITAVTSSARFGQVNNCNEVAAGATCTANVTYFPSNTGADTGVFTVTSTASNGPHVVSLFAASSQVPRLANISTRMQTLTGADVMIGGFVIGGTASKTVVVRARGPSLAPFGIANALANPLLQLFSGQTQIAVSDDWVTATNAQQIAASGFAPSIPNESAILRTLAPGAYTAIVSGAGGATGVGLIEVFEVDRFDVPLVNIATRGQVLTGNDVMIGGFVIQGNAPKSVVVRARGPSLAAAGVPGTLANPTLRLAGADGSTIAVNDDWGSAPNAALITSSGFAPSSPLESVILMTLNPGAYSAILSGVGGTTGVGIVEVFAQ